MKVYRVENEEGKGPYFGVYDLEWTTRDHNTIDHPSLDADNFGQYRFKLGEHSLHDYVFGFDSKKSFTNWFNKSEIKNLYQLGYKLKRFDAEWVLTGESKKQIMFLKEKSKEL